MAKTQAEYVRAWKDRNPNWREPIRARIESFMQELKSGPCTDCGGTFPVECMDFDHLDGTTKVKGVSALVRGGHSKQRILDEVAKCELVCANCHRIRSRKRARSLKNKE